MSQQPETVKTGVAQEDEKQQQLTQSQVIEEIAKAATNVLTSRFNSDDINVPKLELKDIQSELVVKFLKERPNYWEKTGWLPSAEERRAFCNKLIVTDNYDEWDPTVQRLYDYIEYTSSVRQTFVRMCEETVKKALKKHETTPFATNKEMCSKLNAIIKLEPKYSDDTNNPLVGVPMAALFADCATNSPGMALMLSKEFNDILRPVIDKWKDFLDSQESFPIGNGWLSEKAKKEYNFDWYQTTFKDAPYWNSWNDFFTRKYKDGIRKNYGEGNDYAVQLTNDGTEFRYRTDISLTDKFWLKDMPYSLRDIFGFKYKEYARVFKGGSIFQSYLDPFNYHCYNAPVSGTVKVADVLEGAYFPQLVWLYDTPDPGAGTLSLPWLTEVNARGILVIETKKIGCVCIIAIGMGEVSSVNWCVKHGDNVTLGDIVGNFKFGGSSICILTEDMAKYGGKLVYEEKFIPDAENSNITFHVGELMATVQSVVDK